MPGAGEDLRLELLSVPRHLPLRGRDGRIHPLVVTAIQPEHRSPDEMIICRLDRRAAVVDDRRLQARLRHGVGKAGRPAPAEPKRRDPAGGRGQCDRMIAHRVEPCDRISRLQRADEPDDPRRGWPPRQSPLHPTPTPTADPARR